MIESIEYVKMGGDFKRLLIITFKEPTDGMIDLSMRGFIKKIKAYSHKLLNKEVLEYVRK